MNFCPAIKFFIFLVLTSVIVWNGLMGWLFFPLILKSHFGHPTLSVLAGEILWLGCIAFSAWTISTPKLDFVWE